MKRILVNMPSQFGGKPSGVARVAFRLIAELASRPDLTIVLRSPWTRDALPEGLRGRIEVVTVPRPRIMVLDVLRQLLTVPACCRRHAIDLVLNIDPYGAARGGRARVVVVHDLYFRTIPESTGPREARTTDLIFRLMLRGNGAVVAVSDATRRDLEKHYPRARGRVRVIPSASVIDPAALTDGARSEVAGPFILAVGNATHNKNFGLLAEAAARLAPHRPDLAIVHVGEDPDDAIGAVLRRLDAGIRVIRLSRIDDGRLAALYRAALCLCVPSFAEGFCLPVLEAQALGCPVVCANRSATPEVAGEGALTFDPTDPAALAACLHRLLDEPGLRADLAARGRRNEARYTWAATGRAYAALLSDALDPANRSA
ncbi:glycosyltransferase family 4 protein [uncultured Methylobacterium sp.]|uniref:glycosyltransferase family 4 protein n=1 Tax=uncultured Methylobacterium sp. TaxID=157278 RepID=UPI0035CA59C4